MSEIDGWKSLQKVRNAGFRRKRRTRFQFSILTLMTLIATTSGFIAANIDSGSRELIRRSNGSLEIRLTGWGWPFPSYTYQFTLRQPMTLEEADERFRRPTIHDTHLCGKFLDAIFGRVPIHIVIGTFFNGQLLVIMLAFEWFSFEGWVRRRRLAREFKAILCRIRNIRFRWI